MGKLLLSVEQLAEEIELKPRTIYNGVAPKAKKPFPLKPLRIGKCLRFKRETVIKWIEAGCPQKWDNG